MNSFVDYFKLMWPINKKTRNWVTNFIYLKFILKKYLFETMDFQKYLFNINIL